MIDRAHGLLILTILSMGLFKVSLKDIQYGVASGVTRRPHETSSELMDNIVVSDVAVSYENFSMLYSPQFALTTLHHDFNAFASCH